MWADTSDLPHLGLLIFHSLEPRLAVNQSLQPLTQTDVSEQRCEDKTGVCYGRWMARGFLYISKLRCVGFDSVGNLGHQTIKWPLPFVM